MSNILIEKNNYDAHNVTVAQDELYLKTKDCVTPKMQVTQQSAIDALRMLLTYIGEDVTRDGLVDTPKRVIESYSELFLAYTQNPPKLSFFVSPSQCQIIDVGLFSSMCEHHILPFFGSYEFSYRPCGEVIGLSKISRAVAYFSAKLQLQEQLGDEIISYLYDGFSSNAKPLEMKLILRAKHLCKCARGAKSSGETTTIHTIEI
jgi:GTP cyclohydrolase IA